MSSRGETLPSLRGFSELIDGGPGRSTGAWSGLTVACRLPRVVGACGERLPLSDVVTDFGDQSVVIARSVSWSRDGQHIYAAVAKTLTDIVLLDGLL